MGIGPNARAARRRRGTAVDIRRRRGPVRKGAVDATTDLRVAHAQCCQRGDGARRWRDVRDVVLPLPIPAAGARLLTDQGRPLVPADDSVHRDRLDVGLPRRHARRRQASARGGLDRADAGSLPVHGPRGERHLSRQRARALAARRDRDRPFVRPADDLGGRRRRPEGGGPGLRSCQHLAAGRWRARPGDPCRDRRRTDQQRPPSYRRRRARRARGAHQRLPVGVRRGGGICARRRGRRGGGTAAHPGTNGGRTRPITRRTRTLARATSESAGCTRPWSTSAPTRRGC